MKELKKMKKREYVKKIVITLKSESAWSVKFLEGHQRALGVSEDASSSVENFISRKDLNDARRIMFARHRLYQREKLMKKRVEKLKSESESEVAINA